MVGGKDNRNQITLKRRAELGWEHACLLAHSRTFKAIPVSNSFFYKSFTNQHAFYPELNDLLDNKMFHKQHFLSMSNVHLPQLFLIAYHR